jgi:tetratricopeptide (TPR) repeat protein
LALSAAAAVGSYALRSSLVERHRTVRVKKEVYPLPSPEHTVVASLGYRSALADILYANVLVSYGISFQERRAFEFVGNYLDTINALDPTFRSPYRFSDTLLTLQAVRPKLQNYYKAREVLERGLRALPFDAELWTQAGQYIAYLGTQWLESAEEKQRWKQDGARILARACELVSSNENLPYHCITAAGILNDAGNTEAVVRFLERVIAVTDNEEIRSMALAYLERALGEQQEARAKQRHGRYEAAHKEDLPFVGKDLLNALGPRFDTLACAGLEAAAREECVTTWRAWGESAER